MFEDILEPKCKVDLTQIHIDITKLLSYYVFELKDEITRLSIRDSIVNYLEARKIKYFSIRSHIWKDEMVFQIVFRDRRVLDYVL